jgi:pimeloyl-ACP methyl ester carboxylesterase
LDALEVRQPVVFCGLSMGGYVAWQFWRRHGSRLSGLMLCDTRAVSDTPEAAAARREMADRVLREGPGPLVAQMMPKLFAPCTVQDQPEVVEALRRVMMQTDPRGIAAAARGMAERPDMLLQLSQINCPALVIVGELDVISTPEEMRAIAGAIPHARLVEIAGCGHMTPLERPAEVNAAMRAFLGDLK